MLTLLIAFWLALAITVTLTPLAAQWAMRAGAIAVPRERDVHTAPTPRWGGIGIAAGVLVAAAAAITCRHLMTDGALGWSWPLAGVLLAGLFTCGYGVVDDWKDLSPAWQIAGMVGAAAILVACGVRIEGFNNPLVAQAPGSYDPRGWVALSHPASCLVTLIWIGAVVKTVDATDGLDGLAAGICAISAGTLVIIAATTTMREGWAVAPVAVAIVGACVGFLRFNASPARIFMSSSGGQFLGLMLGALSIVGTFKIAAAWSLVVGVLVLGVPLFDYAIVIGRRILDRAPLTAGDQRHLHHRLLARGLSNPDVVYIIYCCTALLCSFALVLAFR